MAGTSIDKRMRGWLWTAACLPAVVAAQLLVALVPMRQWRRTLGDAVPLSGLPQGDVDCEAPAIERKLVIHVQHAAERLPWTVLCLPRAIAIHWLLRLCSLDSLLVIARERDGDGSAEWDALHAWAEREGRMTAGWCDRSSYMPVMAWRAGGEDMSEPATDALRGG